MLLAKFVRTKLMVVVVVVVMEEEEEEDYILGRGLTSVSEFWRQGTSLEMKRNITDADTIVCNTVQGRAADVWFVCVFIVVCYTWRFSVLINMHHRKKCLVHKF
jgi:hypothetical protein